MFSKLIAITLMMAGASAFQTTSPFVHPERATALYMSEVQTGKVKWFNTQKGYGFIVPDDGSTDIFVHQTEIKCEGFRSLADGESVEYVPQVDDRNGKVKATRVTGPDGVDVEGAPFRPDNDYDY